MTKLKHILTETIRSHGPMTVQDYMRLCLQHPEHGYYRRAQAVGAGGDFITAPEISQLFGDLLGMWVVDRIQKPEIGNQNSEGAARRGMSLPPLRGGGEVALVELGPGRGTLMADVMRMIAAQPGMKERISLHLVESNETLRAQQREKLRQYEPVWHDSIDSLPDDRPLVIIANEFFDALPIRQWVGEEERRIASCELRGLHFIPEGAVTREECPAAEAIMAALAKRLHTQGGTMLLVDYGYQNSEFRIQNSEKDTLQAVKAHRYTDPLADPGAADLTAHVDFGALQAAAEAEGVWVHGPLEQGTFLQRLGGDLWLQKLLRAAGGPEQRKDLEEGWLRLISPARMGSLFKVMAVTNNEQPPAGF